MDRPRQDAYQRVTAQMSEGHVLSIGIVMGTASEPAEVIFRTCSQSFESPGTIVKSSDEKFRSLWLGDEDSNLG